MPTSRTVRKLALVFGVLSIASALICGLLYTLHFRPMWQSEAVLNGIPARLVDPATGPDTLRHIALTGHKTLLASFAALDASFQALVGAMVIAGIGFLWLAHLSRRGE